MNTVVNALIERRSVRKFSDQSVPKELIEEIIKAGSFAPSARNQQPGKVVAITNPELISKLSKMNAEIMNVTSDPFFGAPVVLIVFAKKATSHRVNDGTLIAGNILNATHALGLGATWINRAREMFETPEGIELMNEWGFEEEYEGICNIIIGYPAREIPKPPKRKENFSIWID
ncbi:MAG: nitroreductase [Streptococcaceae bacterium]|jgi:nitroreductase|nr:nitroreductase [Streptococcaceae bacterium]